MTQVPGARQWESSLVGHTLYTDYPQRDFFMFEDDDYGGVITFHDGTLWVYASYMPAGGIATATWDHSDPGDLKWWRFAWGGFTILELKPGAEIWERITPDGWGQTIDATASAYPDQPSEDNEFNFNSTGQMTGGIADYRWMYDDQNWHAVHSGEEGDDDVFFYVRGGNKWGPIRVNRADRTWERYITEDNATLEPWYYMLSNMVLDGAYMWFLAQTPLDSDSEVRLVRAEKANPANWTTLKSWPAPSLSYYGYVDNNSGNPYPDDYDSILTPGTSSWRNVEYPEGTSRWKNDEEAFVAHISQNYLRATDIGSIAIDDGYLFLITGNGLGSVIGQGNFIGDGRTTGRLGSSHRPDTRNYDQRFTALYRVRIGDDYHLETLYYSRSPEDFVGKGKHSSETVNTWPQTTAMSWNKEPGVSYSDDAHSYRFGGIGFAAHPGADAYVRDGWLYYLDTSLNQSRDGEMASASAFARIYLPDLIQDAPVRHDSLNPRQEFMTNATSPWDGYNAWGGGRDSYRPPPNPSPYSEVTFGTSSDDRYHYREGTAPLHGSTGQGFMVAEDGSITYCHVTFPAYSSMTGSFAGEWEFLQLGTRTVSRLDPPESLKTGVTVTFTGTALKGYQNIRQSPSSSGDKTLELR